MIETYNLLPHLLKLYCIFRRKIFALQTKIVSYLSNLFYIFTIFKVFSLIVYIKSRLSLFFNKNCCPKVIQDQLYNAFV